MSIESLSPSIKKEVKTKFPVVRIIISCFYPCYWFFIINSRLPFYSFFKHRHASNV